MLLHTGLAPANCEHHISTYLGQVSPGATCHVSGAHIAIIVITSSPHPSNYSALCPDANISSILRDSQQKTDCFLQSVVHHAAGLAPPQFKRPTMCEVGAWTNFCSRLEIKLSLL